MPTTEQIARAKARVALARISGKKLPSAVLERAALRYEDADVPETEDPTVTLARNGAFEAFTEGTQSLSSLLSGRGAPRSAPKVADHSETDAHPSDSIVDAEVVDDVGPDHSLIEHLGFDRRVLHATYDGLAAGPGNVHEDNGLPQSGPPFILFEVKGRESVPGTLYLDASGDKLVSAGNPPNSVDTSVSAATFAVRNTHRTMSGVGAKSPEPQLPLDDAGRERLARSVARDVVTMEPGYARMIASAIESVLAERETREAAEDARLG
jgi:hypothetical protein